MNKDSNFLISNKVIWLLAFLLFIPNFSYGSCDGGTCTIIPLLVIFIILLILFVIFIWLISRFATNLTKPKNTTHSWKQFRSEAQMAEHNGKFQEAINLYTEAINILSNDFSYLNGKQGNDMNKIIGEMNLKVNWITRIIKNGDDKNTPPNHT